VVVFVLENARQPSRGGNVDHVALQVVSPQAGAMRSGQRVSKTGNREAALFGWFAAKAALPWPTKSQPGVEDVAVMGEAVRFKIPHKNVQSHTHLGGGEADARGGMHGVCHIEHQAANVVGYCVNG